ncbi:MAG TPA: C69 family dipeptidase [Bacteroidales bacterium]|nr:C69 family dipeptidase [Bacteroidales bacterium]
MKRVFVAFTCFFIAAFALQQTAYACTNFIITKGATTDGSVMICYTADSHQLYGELYFRAAQDYPEGTLMDVYEWDTGEYRGKIKQARHTFSVVGNMNEFQLAIGETTYGGRSELEDSTRSGIMDYGSLIYIALQRCKTAREAIKLIGELLAEYGYCSSGESFSICDKNEAWIFEMIGKGVGNKGAVWVARRIPDGYISGHANQARITTFPLADGKTSITNLQYKKIDLPAIECIYSSDVIEFARTKGYFIGKDAEFSFADAYAPVDFGAARFCEARVWAGFKRFNKEMDQYQDYAMGENLKNRFPLWIKPDRKLSVYDVMEIMRDHYEGTPMDMTTDLGAGPFKCPYRWRPMTWSQDGGDYIHERATSTQQTGFSFVAQCRAWMPDPIGGIIWFGVDDTYSTVYAPMYCGITKVPESYAVGLGDMVTFNDNAAFWVFNQVSNFAYTRYCDIIPEIRTLQKELETKYIQTEVPAIDAKAAELYKGNPAQALDLITQYSVKTGNNLVVRWKQLYGYLFTKYMDGNVKYPGKTKESSNVDHPRYSDDWYRMIIKETGDRYKVKSGSAH